jgi:hypothetical protein
MKLKLYMTESWSTYICRDVIEIDTENYPEFDGMSKEQIMDCIRDNSYDLPPSVDNIPYDSLRDQLYDCDIIKEKITNEEIYIEFED